MKTKPEVFIIESLRFSDEQDDLFEGQIIKKILALSDKRCEYYYIRTKRELARVLELFTKSEYRYLHLSCHASQHSMATTLDGIDFPELAGLINPDLTDRRLFVSACSMTNDNLAKVVMQNSGCYSILGPDQNLQFSDAAILWASLYHVMFAIDADSMKRKVLKAKAQELADIYRVRLRYFARDSSKTKGYVSYEINPRPEDVV